jgi:hypothetical protein
MLALGRVGLIPVLDRLNRTQQKSSKVGLARNSRASAHCVIAPATNAGQIAFGLEPAPGTLWLARTASSVRLTIRLSRNRFVASRLRLGSRAASA